MAILSNASIHMQRSSYNYAMKPISWMTTSWEFLLLMLANLLPRVIGGKPLPCFSTMPPFDNAEYCLSWRFAVEANNILPWRTVPAPCLLFVENYMLGGQYQRDLDMVVSEIFRYMDGIPAAADGKDAWVLDTDDTCISNLFYYEGKRFGGDPYDPVGFKRWAERGLCPAIPAVLGLYNRLREAGYKVFLLTGRDEEHLGAATTENLHMQGFVGYERLIMRSPTYRGQSALMFKSEIRKQLVAEGYKIRGNVGDQWSDLMGECMGDHTFKLPNPMYFIP